MQAATLLQRISAGESKLTAKGVRVSFVKEKLTFTGEDPPMANLLLSVMGAIAEFERELIKSISGRESLLRRKRVSIKVQPDSMKKITRARPAQAIAELIWNSLDADASYVSVRFGHNPIGRIDSIQLRDNGTGIPYGKAPGPFKRLGGSWKRSGAQTAKEKRFLHGQEGQGHFK